MVQTVNSLVARQDPLTRAEISMGLVAKDPLQLKIPGGRW